MQHTPLARAISLVFTAAALGASGQSLGQDAEQQAEQEPSLETVIVTGTRIRHDGYTSSQPMDVMSPDSASLQGLGDVSRLLQSSTIASGSPQVTAATSTAFVQNGGTGAQTLSLRGLGANRTLVLLNGRRAGPAGVRGGVSSFDFNVLPLSVIERVEILKDGASSIYGSDAVAGVVNIITKKGDGGTVDAYISQPEQSGGEEYRVNASWGKSYSRGNFRVTADYHRENELQKGDRDYFDCGEQYIFDPDTGKRADVVDPRTGKYRCADLPWGHVWIYDYQDEGGNVPRGAKAQYDYDGDLANYIPGFAVDPENPGYMVTPPGWFPVAYDRTSDSVYNADHPFQDGSSLSPRMERITFFGEGEFEITDNVKAYAEVLLNRRKTEVNGYRQFWTYIYNEDFFGGNPLAAGWTGAQWLSPTPITDHSDSEVTVDYQRVAAGLQGDFTAAFLDGWNWDVSIQYSKSDGEYVDDQIYDDAISPYSIFNAEPVIGSCVGLNTPVRGVPCVDVPWLDPEFLRGNVSREVRDFLFGREKGTTTYDQWSLEAFMSGRLFDLPAGPLSVAIGAHYQDDQIKDKPGEITLSGNAWGSSSAGITAGDDKTKAVFAELEIPLLRDLPMVDRLTLSASARYTDVDSYGSGDTYKVGLDWGITPAVRLRASHGTSFRAPALYELYLADQTSFLGQRSIDPCINYGDALEAGEISPRVAANCEAVGLLPDYDGGAITATIITGGGYGVLEAETSTSRTVGLVWQPEFADLSVSVDYFDIEVKDEVDQVGAQNIVYECYDSEFFPSDPLCDLFERDLVFGIDNVRDSFINIAKQTNKGWDVAATYRTNLPWGELTLETQHTFQTEDTRALFAGTKEDFNGEVGDPEWVGRLNATFERGDWTFFWGTSFIGSSSNHERFGGNTTTYRGETVKIVLETDTVMYSSASVARRFDDWGLTARLGVSNVMNEPPPRVTTLNLGELNTVGTSAFYSQYDWLGRRYFLNFTKDF
ncbi:MAG: TonB-dependent receptor [Steroidobacteraceae bacterium]